MNSKNILIVANKETETLVKAVKEMTDEEIEITTTAYWFRSIVIGQERLRRIMAKNKIKEL